MKKNPMNIILSTVGVILLFSCEQELLYKNTPATPKLVLYSFIEPDSVITADIQKTMPYGETEPSYRPDSASGEIYINGNYAGRLYLDSIRAKAGDRVRITARAQGLKEVSAETVFPPTPEISVDTFTTYGTGEGFFQGVYDELNFHIKITDDGKQRNYYRLAIETQTIITHDTLPPYTLKQYDFNRKGEPVLQGISSNLLDDQEEKNKYALFTNEMFKGKTYTLKVGALLPAYTTNRKETIHYIVKVLHIDEASWRYMNSLELAQKTIFLQEPVKVYSNIPDGIGIVGGFSTAVRIFEKSPEPADKK